jgi:hypothetical protein
MRFSLRTLIVTTIAIPPLIAAVWWYPIAGLVVLSLVAIFCFLILQQPTPEEWN